MKMRFRNNNEPCLQYEVKNAVPIIEYDEQLKKYCECIELAVLGLVPKELLTEANHSDNVDGIDVAIHLTNKN